VITSNLYACSVSPSGYGQWIALELSNRSEDSVWITGINLDYGKLYDGSDMNNEVSTGSVIGTEIKSKELYTVWSCGRKSSPSGTEGTVTISDKRINGTRVLDVYWDCPYTGKNKLEKRKPNKDWFVDVPTVQPDGAIGRVTAKFRKDD